MSNGGAQANSNGQAAENMIAGLLRSKGVVFERQRRIGRGIYGTMLRADFYLPKAPGLESGLIIESKWQDASGTVDEKLPYLVENIFTCYPCPVLIVIDGEGWREGAIAWLKSRADGRTLIGALSLSQLLSWANRTWRKHL